MIQHLIFYVYILQFGLHFNLYYIKMIEIKPVKIGLPPQEATHILVRPIIESTTDLCCNTYYEVVGQTLIEDTETHETRILQTGNYRLTEEQYAQRGSDNTYIEDIVLDYL